MRRILFALLIAIVVVASGFLLCARFMPVRLSFSEDAIIDPTGRWVFQTQKVPALPLRGAFVFDLGNRNRIERLGLAAHIAERPVFSGDGRYLATVRSSFANHNFVADVIDLTEDREIFRHEFETSPIVAFSPDSQRLAVQTDTTLFVYDIRAGKLIAKTAVPETGLLHPYFFFPDAGHVRLYTPQRGEPHPGRVPVIHRIWEYDIQENTLVETGGVLSRYPGLFLRPEQSGRFLISLQKNRTIVTLHDGRSGRRLADLETGGLKLRDGLFLSDWAIGIVFRLEEQSRFQIYWNDGVPRCSVDLPIAAGAVCSRELVEGNVAVALNRFEEAEKHPLDWRIFVIGAYDCEIKREIPSMIPMQRKTFWEEPALTHGPAPSSNLFRNPEGKFIRLP